MQHRHLNHTGYTLAAIDDIIARGGVQDWLALEDALLADSTLFDKVEKVCQAHLQDPTEQRFFFWSHYVQQHR